MKTRNIPTLVVSSLCAVLLTYAGQASAWKVDHRVTQSQLDSLHAGESRDDIVKTLGAPEAMTNWPEGYTSLSYEIDRSYEPAQIVYVDVDKSGHMINVETLDF